MRWIIIAATFAGAAFTGSAFAQTGQPAPVPGPGMGMMRADSDGDGVVTRAEATAQADAQFAAMDVDHDGKVTGDERRAAFQARAGGGRMRGRGGTHGGGDTIMTRDDFRARALARFDRTDTNHDGKIDAAEIEAMRQMRMQRRNGAGTAPAPAPQQ